ncbi:MAG: ABC transporter ATP-binding protein [Candidatus Magnetomorum sp.]|nr:ABC transporter ATP-binding protein [Candidatus Magnetomorum sp.]
MRTLQDISLSLDNGQILCLLGPSGCGKTTLLRLIAGLEAPETGTIIFDGKDITHLKPHKRQFGLMFQEFALFPHKNVFENVAFGLKMQHLDSIQIKQRAWEMLDLVGMTELAKRNVIELSGGERQRVALARSLAPQPRLLMLDEPLGALDRHLRERLLPEIHSILKKLNIPAIFVTHDQTEALIIADQIAVMHDGMIEQLDTPANVYQHPKTVFVARFLGFHNIFAGTVTTDGAIKTEHGIFHPDQEYLLPDTSVKLIFRHEGAIFNSKEALSCHYDTITGLVEKCVFTGPTFQIQINVANAAGLIFDLPNFQQPPQIGDTISLALHPSSMSVIPL